MMVMANLFRCFKNRMAMMTIITRFIRLGLKNTHPGKPELKIEDLWYRFALSFPFKSIEFLKYSIWLWHKIMCKHDVISIKIGIKNPALQNSITPPQWYW